MLTNRATPASAATSTAATQGLLIGTVAYLSPEQVERGIADARSDVYGAGILLYNRAGALPGAGLEELIAAVKGLDMNEIRAEIAKQGDEIGDLSEVE